MEKATRFTRLDEGVWAWDGDELYDRHGVLLAYVTADVLTVGQTRLLMEHSAETMRFRMRATSPTGAFGTIRQTGMTVMNLHAFCGEREYHLKRSSYFRKDRDITLADGRVAAVIRPQRNGLVEVHDGPAYGDLPVLDSVFLSWGCVLIDAPRQRTRI